VTKDLRSPPEKRTAAGKALAVLDVFGPGSRQLSLTTIARRSGLALATTHRIVGELTAMSLDSLTVKDGAGEHTLRLDDDSYCRGQMGNRILRPGLLGEFHPGSAVIIANDGDYVVNMRPQH
jgi:hypothetical protein